MKLSEKYMELRGNFHISFMGAGNQDMITVENMMENLLLDFDIKGFPYISTVDGGY